MMIGQIEQKNGNDRNQERNDETTRQNNRGINDNKCEPSRNVSCKPNRINRNVDSKPR